MFRNVCHCRASSIIQSTRYFQCIIYRNSEWESGKKEEKWNELTSLCRRLTLFPSTSLSPCSLSLALIHFFFPIQSLHQQSAPSNLNGKFIFEIFFKCPSDCSAKQNWQKNDDRRFEQVILCLIHINKNHQIKSQMIIMSMCRSHNVNVWVEFWMVISLFFSLQCSACVCVCVLSPPSSPLRSATRFY